jgi:hypothetical protein
MEGGHRGESLEVGQDDKAFFEKSQDRQAIEWQPGLFDGVVASDLRFEIAKVRKGLFVRHNALEAQVRMLKEHVELLNRVICRGA